MDNTNNVFCINNCNNEYNKVIEEKKQCVKQCNTDTRYKFEFRKKCYEECPEGTEKNETNNYFFEIKCSKAFPLEEIQNQNCVAFCGINDWKNGLCKSNYEDEDTNAELILENILYDLINNNPDAFFSDGNNEIIIKEKWATFTLTNTNINKDEINIIKECENILRNYYNIPSEKYLYILIINIEKENMNNIKYEYEVYYPLNGINLEKLDLNLCPNPEFKIAKCSNYSLGSILNELCISCKEGFYPIYNDQLNKNSFIKCYKDPEGYYLNESIWKYKPCYLSCQTCDGDGNELFHNCLKCKIENQKKLKYEKI